MLVFSVDICGEERKVRTAKRLRKSEERSEEVRSIRDSGGHDGIERRKRRGGDDGLRERCCVFVCTWNPRLYKCS